MVLPLLDVMTRRAAAAAAPAVKYATCNSSGVQSLREEVFIASGRRQR